ncbi:MAG: phosphate regulon sensor histidine kinase PhoR [Burkholderiaceae bacterium]|jgi:two-component system phosphate regulon sensor histidine kinase PhoR|nr:phosphate regulon sensor histidine kinase PhoR [Burkholderiaceae bacterium]
MKWQRTLILFTLSVLVATALQVYAHTPAGWIILALATGGLLVDRRRQASRVAAWAESPDTAPPAGIGAWEEVVAALYRHNKFLKQTRDELQQTNAAIMSAARALPMGAVTLNRDFQIHWFNGAAEKLLRLKTDRDVGQNLLNLLRSPEFVAYASKGDWSSHVVVRLSWGSGQDQTLMMQLVPYALDQILLLARDLTQIERLETIRRDFVANVSHEMRTPLTVLSGFLETLIDAPTAALSEEQRSHYLQLMQDQTRRMTALVADLLTLSDLESTLAAERTPLDMEALFGGARHQAEALSAGRHRFEWEIEPGLNILGHEPEIQSAFLNLLTNAVRYTPDGGKITVRWQTAPDQGAVYSVTDTGIGIASEHLPRLTERFYRVDRGRSRELGGTGLGLAIAKHVAMRHDAQLDIRSKLGQGSVFSLTFDHSRVIRRDDAPAS